jgi:diguanylate cyclase (GGDEF)-like protein/PAS domain S-box-containing protein
MTNPADAPPPARPGPNPSGRAASTRRTRILGLVAAIGLGLVLLSLCGFAIWAAYTAHAAADRVGTATTEQSAFDKAHYAVGQEESLERKYRLEPGPDILAQHRAAGAALVAALGQITAKADSADKQLAADVIGDHERYLAATGRMFAAVDAGNTPLVNEIDANEVDPLFAGIQERVEASYADHEAEHVQVVSDLRRTDATILWSTAAASAVGAILMAGFLFVLRAYQRHLDEAAAGEQAALAASEARFRSLVQNSSDMITVIDPAGMVRYQSAASARVLGLDPAAVLDRRAIEFLHPDDVERVAAFFADAMNERGAPATVEARLRHRDGSWRNAEVMATNRLTDEHVGGFVLNIRDVTERHELEEQLRHQAFHDTLTGLANRARFIDRLEHELARSTRHGRAAAVLFLDLDDFKSVNDALGHPAGDLLLVAVAARLEANLRPGDTTARFGGDEFAILLDDCVDASQAMEAGDRIIAALRAPFDLDGNEVFVRASVGVALSQGGRMRGDELLRRADVAMYAAKAAGKGRCHAYEPGMQTTALERLTLAGDLQRAIERDEFVVRYQPLIELSTGRIAGFEALVRWRHPLRGLLPPDDFIALAEDTGLIVPIGRWVLTRACAQARRWQQAYPSAPALSMAVNISTRQVHAEGLTQTVWEALRDAGLPPGSLVLEITESVMMQDTEAAIARLEELKALGVRLAVDDFGTGYSSLSYLRRFPIDVLKIDKSFVDGVDTQAKEAELAHAIVDMARALGMEIVAEGIERPEQLARLQSLCCDFGQGYYFAHPLDEDAIDALLRAAAQGARMPIAQAA